MTIVKLKYSTDGISDEEMDFYIMERFKRLMNICGINPTEYFFHRTYSKNLNSIIENGLGTEYDKGYGDGLTGNTGKYVYTRTFIEGIDITLEVDTYIAIIVIDKSILNDKISYWNASWIGGLGENTLIYDPFENRSLKGMKRKFKRLVWRKEVERENNLWEDFSAELKSGKYTKDDLHMGPAYNLIEVLFEKYIAPEYIKGVVLFKEDMMEYIPSGNFNNRKNE